MNQPEDLQRHGKRVTREELYEAVWLKTLKALAKEWNTTRDHLLLACKKINVPRPDQKYWPLLSWGNRVSKKRLPRRGRRTPGETLLLARGRVRKPLAGTEAAEEERRRLAEIRELEEKRQLEERRRRLLVESSEGWFKARRLRRFIRACESVVRNDGVPETPGNWAESWFAWAREQADRLDLDDKRVS
jgi:hypothetical protein